MNPSFWLAASFYLVAGLWTVFVAWPFMRDTRRAAVEGLRLSIHTADALDSIVSEVRSLAAEGRACTADVDRERVDKLLKAVESLPAKIDGLGSAAVKESLRKL
jgi:hypothetical protein